MEKVYYYAKKTGPHVDIKTQLPYIVFSSLVSTKIK